MPTLFTLLLASVILDINVNKTADSKNELLLNYLHEKCMLFGLFASILQLFLQPGDLRRGALQFKRVGIAQLRAGLLALPLLAVQRLQQNIKTNSQLSLTQYALPF